MPPCGASLLMARGGSGAGITRHCRIPFAWRAIRKRRRTSRAVARRDSCSSGAKSFAPLRGKPPYGARRQRSRYYTAPPSLIGFGRAACACRGGAKRRRSRIRTVTCFYGQFLIGFINATRTPESIEIKYCSKLNCVYTS